jgi:hypothetical protein
VRFPLQRIKVVEAQLDGLSFSVSIHVPLKKFFTYVLLLITLIEILFSRPIDILQIFELISMGVFVMYANGLC